MDVFDEIIKRVNEIDTGNIALNGSRANWSADDLKQLLDNIKNKIGDDYLEIGTVYDSSKYKIITERDGDIQLFKIVRR